MPKLAHETYARFPSIGPIFVAYHIPSGSSKGYGINGLMQATSRQSKENTKIWHISQTNENILHGSFLSWTKSTHSQSSNDGHIEREETNALVVMTDHIRQLRNAQVWPHYPSQTHGVKRVFTLANLAFKLASVAHHPPWDADENNGNKWPSQTGLLNPHFALSLFFTANQGAYLIAHLEVS